MYGHSRRQGRENTRASLSGRLSQTAGPMANVYPQRKSQDMLTTNESLFFIDQHIILRRIFAR